MAADPFVSHRSAVLAALGLAPAPPTGSRRVRVLIVDDEVHLAHTLARGLQRAFSGSWAADVLTAHSPEEALRQVEAWNDGVPLVVLSDYNFGPTRTGIALAREIQDRDPNARCVLMSGYDRGLFEGELPRARFEAVLGKPLDLPSLRRLLLDLADGAPAPRGAR